MWGVNANCYAYACNCPNPSNGLSGAAIPGGLAGEAVFRRQADSATDYATRLLYGAVLDAAKNGLDKAQTSTDINTLPYYGSGYIVAMVSGDFGFHFFRRDRVTGLWSWKDGNGADPDDKLMRNNASTTVNDALFIRAVTNDRQLYAPNWPNMEFRGYIGLGNINGMTVAGRLSQGAVMP